MLALVVACGGSSDGTGGSAGDGGQGGTGGSAGAGDMGGNAGEGGTGGMGGNAGEGGTGGSAGEGGQGGAGGSEPSCVDSVCSCDEAGIREAIAEGGGPFTFDCGGPISVRVGTEAEIVIDNDVILDGEGSLTVSGRGTHRVFSVPPSVTAELRGLTVTNGSVGQGYAGGGVLNQGTLTLTDCTVSWNIAGVGGGIDNVIGTLTLINTTLYHNTAEAGGGIDSQGTVTLINSTLWENTAATGGGVYNGGGPVTLINSSVSENVAHTGGGFFNVGPLTVANSTVSLNAARYVGGIDNQAGSPLTLINSTLSGNMGRQADGIDNTYGGDLIASGTLIDDNDCVGVTALQGGYNIESPGDTCGFDRPTDQVNVSADDLKLGPLQDNGGPTMTHALGAGSVAIDVMPEAECLDADGEPLTTDQRGEPRPGGTMCDVGAFEVQP
jgi:hypothetical protein